jgi:hypothetical protein
MLGKVYKEKTPEKGGGVNEFDEDIPYYRKVCGI